jgi:nucleoside 2-deoxyribosyltransferase
MKEIRNVDLRMVDISDFIIANIDLDVHACGTYEEITTANRQKKPIIVRMKQGKSETPDWLLGMLGSSHDMIFNTWEQITDYLKSINGCSESSVQNLNHHGRWVFFDLRSLYDKILNGV